MRAAGTAAPYSGMPAGKRPGNGNVLLPNERTEREKAFPATRLCLGKDLSETVFYAAPIVCPSRRADSPPRRPCRSGKARSGCRRRYYGTWTGRTRCRSSCFPTCGRSSGRPVAPAVEHRAAELPPVVWFVARKATGTVPSTAQRP